MALQPVTLANAFAGVIPAAIVFFMAYGRYDGTFRDNVVFIYFIGGLILGGFLGFLSLFTLASVTPLIAILLLALVVPVSIVAGINRRKWQGERHAVFNGGALGLGVAVMTSFSFLYFHSSQMSDEAALSLATIGQGLLLSAAFTGLFFGLGLLAGDAVRRRVQLRVAFLGTATFLAPLVFLEELFRTWERGDPGAWLWIVLLAAYGAVYGIVAERRLLIHGVSDEARRMRRRLRRKRRVQP